MNRLPFLILLWRWLHPIGRGRRFQTLDGIHVKRGLRLVLVWLVAGAVSGCVSAYKNVRVSVTDSVTHEPVAGAWVSASYHYIPFYSLATQRPAQAVTDESGTALMRVNCPSSDPSVFGWLYQSGHVGYRAAISNDNYHAVPTDGTPLAWFGMDRRPGDFIPKSPDIYLEVVSDKEKQRGEAEAKLTVVNTGRAVENKVEKLFRESPEFWPAHYPDPGCWVQEERDGSMKMLLSKRWESGAKTGQGNPEDVAAIREAVLHGMKMSNEEIWGRMKFHDTIWRRKVFSEGVWRQMMVNESAVRLMGPKALAPVVKTRVTEIRWLSPLLVMVDCGWRMERGPSPCYYYVVQKNGGKWEVIAYYMVGSS